MGVPGNADLLLLKTAAAAGGYQVSRSLRFNGSVDNSYLRRTPASAGNRKTWTWAGWIKRSTLGTVQQFFTCSTSGYSSSWSILGFNGDKLQLWFQNGSYPGLQTTAVYRDTGAWMHVLMNCDTTQATSGNRGAIYVNGVKVTAFDLETYPSQNFDTDFNSTSAHDLGRQSSGGYYCDFMLADVYWIDGQALTPSSFTETDASTGQLIPKAFAGSYGTNGFHLEFADNSAATAAALGKDTSGNSNNWTPNNLSVTAGAGNDSLVDTPTSYGTDTGVGGEVRGNYCTLNPLANGGTLSNGNLDATSGTNKVIYSTFALDSGKYYWEITLNASNLQQIGIADVTKTNTTNSAPGDSGRNGYIYLTNGSTYNNGTLLGSGLGSSTTGDVIGVAYDGSSNKLWLRKNNGSWFGGGDPAAGTSPTMTTSTSYTYTPVLGAGGGTDAVNASCNWGQRSWAYSAPSGYKALCDTNLTSPVIAKSSTAFDVKLYTGNGSTQTISGLGFSPDFVWLKSRSSGSYSHNIYDAVRGATKIIYSDSTSAENTDASGLTAFNSDGFSLGSTAATNASSTTYVGWCWDAGTSTVTNTQGSITSSVRANASAGFSIVTYTGNGSSSQSIGHGLGVAPKMVIIKNRNGSPSYPSWYVRHESMASNHNARLELTEKTYSTTTEFFQGGIANLTSSTVVSFNTGTNAGGSGGGNGNVNTSGVDYVAYCFAPVAGYSSFGSWTGNGSTDGPFVYTGFRPRWVMWKPLSSGTDWVVRDAARDSYNIISNYLLANSSVAEGSIAEIDFLSNGFKFRNNLSGNNSNGTQVIYACFAESPFQYARAR